MAVQLGASGALDNCEQGPSIWGGNVLVSGTTGTVEVSDNIIRGNLNGTGNDAVTASDNRVRGNIEGQFAESGEESLLQMQAEAQTEAQTGRESLEQLRSERLADAEELADAAGPANL